jgi:hypothetical protein
MARPISRGSSSSSSKFNLRSGTAHLSTRTQDKRGWAKVDRCRHTSAILYSGSNRQVISRTCWMKLLLPLPSPVHHPKATLDSLTSPVRAPTHMLRPRTLTPLRYHTLFLILDLSMPPDRSPLDLLPLPAPSLGQHSTSVASNQASLSLVHPWQPLYNTSLLHLLVHPWLHSQVLHHPPNRRLQMPVPAHLLNHLHVLFAEHRRRNEQVDLPHREYRLFSLMVPLTPCRAVSLPQYATDPTLLILISTTDGQSTQLILTPHVNRTLRRCRLREQDRLH